MAFYGYGFAVRAFFWLDFSVGEVVRRVSTAAVMDFAPPLTVIL